MISVEQLRDDAIMMWSKRAKIIARQASIRYSVDYEDIYQDLMLEVTKKNGLIKHFRLRGAVLDSLRRFPWNCAFSRWTGERFNFQHEEYGNLPMIDNTFNEIETRRCLGTLMSILPKRYYYIIYQILCGRLERDLGKELGVDSTRVSQIRGESIKRMRRYAYLRKKSPCY